MERNQFLLFLSFLFSTIATILGIAILFSGSSLARYSSGTGGSLFQASEIGAVVIPIVGEIHSGESTFDSTGTDTILRQLRDLEEDGNIKGILLEINSPGGTVAASQEIFNELLHLRKTKKIVVSMKDVAASGGYYIASASDYIFAENGTITGSIGVISFAPNVKGLLDRYGVGVRTYKAGKYKDMYSPFRDSTNEEDDMIGKQLQDTYRKFVEDVAKGRNKTVKSIEELAEGKIYSGEDAFRNKLVDDIGGRREAHKKLSELCQYEGEIPLFEQEYSPFERMIRSLGVKFLGEGSQTAKIRSLLQSQVLVILPTSLGKLML
ncbi:signal peptide peptidase SppA [Leptospira levettii]|nr:signal peptide peptidase SppA [Leptospira levettii]TGM84084.1 signal peptide peptidase SppA [Leptospira levettii]